MTVAGTSDGGVGSTARVTDVSSGPAAALAAIFDSTATPVGVGDPLPPLWHWAALSGWPAASGLRADGHPHDRALTGPPGFSRRMFGGGEIRLFGQALVGARVHVTREVSDLVRKHGRSGTFYTAEAITRICDDSGTVLIEERQDILFRPEAQPSESNRLAPRDRPLVGSPLRRIEVGLWSYRTDPSLLMRFSAATSNPHRIHYDWPYATVVEGYPDLVVHGPLTILAAMEVFRSQHPDRRVESVQHRGLRPLFVGADAHIVVSDTTPDQAPLQLAGRSKGFAVTELIVVDPNTAATDNPPHARMLVAHSPA